MLERSLEWAKKAVALDVDNGLYHHTLASIQCALDRTDDALKSAGQYLMDVQAVRETLHDATDLLVGLAARGEARKALNILLDSPAAEELEPLAVGIRIFLGENVKVAAEIKEIGHDVAKRICQLQDELKTSDPPRRK